MKVGSGMFEPDLYQFSFIHDDRVSTLKRSREKERVTPISDSFLRKLQIDTICYETLYLPRVSHTHTHARVYSESELASPRIGCSQLHDWRNRSSIYANGLLCFFLSTVISAVSSCTPFYRRSLLAIVNWRILVNCSSLASQRFFEEKTQSLALKRRIL